MPEGRLYIGTRRYSSWSLRGWLSVHLAQLDVEDVVIPLDGGGPTSQVARSTPSGMVPYLEHRGLRIWDTLAIAEYCASWPPISGPAPSPPAPTPAPSPPRCTRASAPCANP